VTHVEQLRDVEAELEAEQRRGRDLQAENRKLSRMLQELRTQSDDDRRAMTELADQVNTLQQRIKTLRRQLEEAVSNCGGRAATSAGRPAIVGPIGRPFEERRLKPRPHQQQRRSNVRLCRSNIRLCCHKRQQCRTFIVKFRPFDKVETN